MPAIAPGAGRAAAVDGGEQPQAGAVPLAGAGRLELHQGREPGLHGLGGNGSGSPNGANSMPNLVQVLVRQVDAVVAEVLADIAQDVGDLQRDAEVVGHLGLLLRVAGAVDAKREPADRARHAAAVPEQVVERLVAGLVHVGQAAVDELGERGQRDVEAGPASASATSTGSVSSKAGGASPAARCPWPPLPAGRPGRGPPRAAPSWSRAGRSPSPMSSMRRANAYTAASARRLSRGSSLMP